MLKRGLVLVMSLAFVSSAFAGATVDFMITDRGNTPCNGIDGCTFNPVAGPFTGGETVLVHVMVTADQDLKIRGAQVDLRASSPELTIGEDIDAVNQPIDGVPNFWFDYSPITIAGLLQQGTYPASGINPISVQSTTGGYTDFSNLMQGNPLIPFPAATSFGGTTETANMLTLSNGVPTRLGGVIVTLPTDPGVYTLDVLNIANEDQNFGAIIDFGFGTGPGDEVTKWASTPGADGRITYANGPLLLEVIPEPATLILLGLGGLAALRRRRS